MEDNLSAPVLDFAQRNTINGYFVKAVIETAAELKKDMENPLFPSMVLSRIGQQQKEFITESVNQMMHSNKDLAEEYNMPATESDFERVPRKFRDRFPADTNDWKNKDIAIYTRWLMYFDQLSNSAPLLQTIDKILIAFTPQILNN